MTSNPTIMLVGLPPTHSSAVLAKESAPPPEVRAMIKEQLDALPEQMRNAGVEFEFFDVAPDQSDGLNRLRDALKSKSFDGVVIGNGIRSNVPLTAWLEQLVDIVRETSPHAKLMFNTTPATSVDAVRRWFPIKGA